MTLQVSCGALYPPPGIIISWRASAKLVVMYFQSLRYPVPRWPKQAPSQEPSRSIQSLAVPLLLFQEAIGPGQATPRSLAPLQPSTSGRPAAAPVTPDHLPYHTSQPRPSAQRNTPPHCHLGTPILPAAAQHRSS